MTQRPRRSIKNIVSDVQNKKFIVFPCFRLFCGRNGLEMYSLEEKARKLPQST